MTTTATLAPKAKLAKSFSSTMTPNAGRHNVFANIAEGIDSRMVGTIVSGSKSRLDQFEADLRMMVSAARLFAALEPFAAALEGYDSTGPDAWSDDDPIADTHFTVGQLRAAAEAVAEARGNL